MSESAPTAAETRRLAEEARDRVRFEEEALQLSDQVFRVARRLVNSREEAEDLVQDTYARAFRSWQQFQPGTNLRAWLLRILTNLNIDRGRRVQRTPDLQPLEAVLPRRPTRPRRRRRARCGARRPRLTTGQGAGPPRRPTFRQPILPRRTLLSVRELLQVAA